MPIPPHIGQLRQTVVVQTPTESDDATTGGVSVTWSTHATVYMQIRYRSGTAGRSLRERLTATGEVVAGASAEGWMRYLPSITSKMRIIDGANVWRIQGPPENWEKKGEWLRLELVMDE